MPTGVEAVTLMKPKSKNKKMIFWGIGCLVAVTLVAIGGLMLTFVPAKLELPQVDVGNLPPASPPAEMSISALPTGTYESPAALAFRGGSWSETRHLAMTALLIRHPKGDLLIDAGAGKNVDEHIKTLPWFQKTPYAKGSPAAAQLEANGIRPSDLAGIIPTHGHWDHISGVEDLAGVPVMESAAGKEFLDSERQDMALLNSFHGVRYKQYGFEGGPYLGFPRSHDVWGDGSVVIVPAPGHTPDSVIVFVALLSGDRYALLGDLVFQHEGITIPAEKPWMMRLAIGENNAEIRKDISLMRAATAKYPQIHLIPAHDSSAWGMIPVLPASAH